MDKRGLLVVTMALDNEPGFKHGISLFRVIKYQHEPAAEYVGILRYSIFENHPPSITFKQSLQLFLLRFFKLT